uniref:Uncharacterized protein n=1 Tax=Arundo donax TaxID=35708 RepID=A0A0A8Z553_ARUDO
MYRRNHKYSLNSETSDITASQDTEAMNKLVTS